MIRPSTANQQYNAAFLALGQALQPHGIYLPLEARHAAASAVLAAIHPHAEHCTHAAATHHAHHDQPVTGCPWCATPTTEPHTIDAGEYL